MTHLRIVVSRDSRLTADEACLAAFQKELDYVYRTLRRLGTSPSEVEDLAQEVFLVLCRCWSEYDQKRPLRPFLFGISFRIAAAYERKRSREVPFGIVDVGDSCPGPDEALDSKQARSLVLAALDRIPLARRAVLVMHDIDGVPMREVASALKVPLFTVYSRRRKARRELESFIRRLLKEADA